MQVYIKYNIIKTFEEEKRNIFWYDNVEKKLEKFSASKLEFKRVFSNKINNYYYKAFPVIKKKEKVSVNIDEVKRLILEYTEENKLDASVLRFDKQGVVIEFKSKDDDFKDYDDLYDFLQRRGIVSWQLS